MSSLNGTYRLVYEDARWSLFQMMLLYITAPLLIFWILVGLLFGTGDDVVQALSGPSYFIVAAYPILVIKKLFPIAIGLGSTRIQFLKTFYATGLAAVVLSMLVLNICQYILQWTYLNWVGTVTLLHPAQFLLTDYHFFSYFWMDLMFVLFLFGMSAFSYCVYHRLGVTRSLALFMIIPLTGLFLYYGGVLDPMLESVGELNITAMQTVSVLGLIGLIALLITYPLMKNAELEVRPRK